MATSVLVHPAWFGGWCWKKVTPLLRAHGHDVYTPTLTGLGERAHLARPDVGLETHIEDVVRVLHAEAKAWRGPDGKLKSRPTASKWLLSPFIACGVCGSSMHAKKSGKNYRYVCTARHTWGAAKCSNPRGLAVTIADKVLLGAFEEALAGKLVLDALEEFLDGHRRRSMDPVPLKAEVQALKVEISNLVAGLAKGDLEDIHDAVRARKARLEHLEGQLQGIGAARDFNLAEFTEKVGPILKNWREHLKRNPHTAQQVLRKILPTKITVTPLADGGWRFDGLCDYRKVLVELGLDAVTAVLEETAKSSGTPARRAGRRAP